jgi:hypothetical protein
VWRCIEGRKVAQELAITVVTVISNLASPTNRQRSSRLVTLVKRGPLGDRDSDGGNTVHTFPVRIVGRIPRRRRARVKITCPTRREEAAAAPAYYRDRDTDDSHGTQSSRAESGLDALAKTLPACVWRSCPSPPGPAGLRERRLGRHPAGRTWATRTYRLFSSTLAPPPSEVQVHPG